MLRVRLKVKGWGVSGISGITGKVDLILSDIPRDDFNIAALTEESIPTSLGRRVEGICSSSYIHSVSLHYE